MKKIILILLILIVLVNVSATDVLREISPQNPKANDIIEVKINILNEDSTISTYEVEEKIPGEIELIDPKNPFEIRQFDGLSTPVLKWNVKVSPNQITSIKYKIKPLVPGQLTLPPIKLTEFSTGAIIIGETNELIVKCKPNNACGERENYLNCPEDCTTGAEDGICNPILDGICDVDCTQDPDCGEKITDNTTLYYIIAGIILALIIFLVVIKILGSRDEGDDEPIKKQEKPKEVEKNPLKQMEQTNPQQYQQPQQQPVQQTPPQQENQQDPLAEMKQE